MGMDDCLDWSDHLLPSQCCLLDHLGGLPPPAAFGLVFNGVHCLGCVAALDAAGACGTGAGEGGGGGGGIGLPRRLP